MITKQDELYMQEALKEAEQALASRDEPVGAVIVHGARVVARAHNQVKLLRDPTALAAIIAITQAASTLESEQLTDCTVYVTKEPDAMCVGALLLSGAARLVFGAADAKMGACGSVVDLMGNERLNRRVTVEGGVMAAECHTILRKAASGIFI